VLDCEYFHVVFTVPHAIAAIALQNTAVVYRLLFRATADTLRTIAADPRHLGAEIGFIAVLHTWGQTLVPRRVVEESERQFETLHAQRNTRQREGLSASQARLADDLTQAFPSSSGPPAATLELLAAAARTWIVTSRFPATCRRRLGIPLAPLNGAVEQSPKAFVPLFEPAVQIGVHLLQQPDEFGQGRVISRREQGRLEGA